MKIHTEPHTGHQNKDKSKQNTELDHLEKRILEKQSYVISYMICSHSWNHLDMVGTIVRSRHTILFYFFFVHSQLITAENTFPKNFYTMSVQRGLMLFEVFFSQFVFSFRFFFLFWRWQFALSWNANKTKRNVKVFLSLFPLHLAKFAFGSSWYVIVLFYSFIFKLNGTLANVQIGVDLELNE